MKENEIDLNLVPQNGETWTLSSEEISKMSILNAVAAPSESNSIWLKVTPIGTEHFEVHTKTDLNQIYSCTRCGEDYVKQKQHDLKDYLSLKKEEGEDQGFIVLESSKWDWHEFLVDTIELETPYLTHQDCPVGCKNYKEAMEAGLISQESPKNNAFKGLEALKKKLN